MLKYIYQGKYNGNGFVLPEKKKKKTKKQLMVGLRRMKDLYAEPEQIFPMSGEE